MSSIPVYLYEFLSVNRVKGLLIVKKTAIAFQYYIHNIYLISVELRMCYPQRTCSHSVLDLANILRMFSFCYLLLLLRSYMQY